MLISSLKRKPSVDMFPQRGLQLKIYRYLIFDSYPLISKHLVLLGAFGLKDLWQVC